MGPVTMDKWVCALFSLCDMRSSKTLKTEALNTGELKKKLLHLGHLVLRIQTVVAFLFHS